MILGPTKFELSAEHVPCHHRAPCAGRRNRDGNPFPEIQDNWRPGLLPAQTGSGHPTIGCPDGFSIGEMTVMRQGPGGPTLDIFGPSRTLAEHDLVVAGIGIDDNFETMLRQSGGKGASDAYIDE